MEQLWTGNETKADKLNKILFIDDDPMIQDIVSQVIKIAGYEPLLASDWVEWVEQYLKQVSTIVWVLLDKKLWKWIWRLNWAEVLKEILKVDNKARVVICSWDITEQELNWEFKGAVWIIEKPLNMAILFNSFKKYFWK